MAPYIVCLGLLAISVGTVAQTQSCSKQLELQHRCLVSLESSSEAETLRKRKHDVEKKCAPELPKTCSEEWQAAHDCAISIIKEMDSDKSLTEVRSKTQPEIDQCFVKHPTDVKQGFKDIFAMDQNPKLRKAWHEKDGKNSSADEPSYEGLGDNEEEEEEEEEAEKKEGEHEDSKDGGSKKAGSHEAGNAKNGTSIGDASSAKVSHNATSGHSNSSSLKISSHSGGERGQKDKHSGAEKHAKDNKHKNANSSEGSEKKKDKSSSSSSESEESDGGKSGEKKGKKWASKKHIRPECRKTKQQLQCMKDEFKKLGQDAAFVENMNNLFRQKEKCKQSVDWSCSLACPKRAKCVFQASKPLHQAVGQRMQACLAQKGFTVPPSSHGSNHTSTPSSHV